MRAYRKRILGALAIGLAAASTYSYLSRVGSSDRLAQLLTEVGTVERDPAVVADLRRATDAEHGKLIAARALLADELDRRWLADLDSSEQQAAAAVSLRKLTVARDLAREVMAERPASWQARMILAGSHYLLQSRSGAPDRWRNRSSWEGPLLAAIEQAPHEAEPKRILAAAYLNEWSVMTQLERRSALPLLGEAFRSAATFDQLLTSWLARADSLDQALSLVPDDPASWMRLETHFRSRRDWERVCLSRLRGDESRAHHLAELLDQAETRLSGGDAWTARSLSLQVFDLAPIGPAYVDTLRGFLKTLPAGPIPTHSRLRARDWLEWARRECLLRDCLLPKDSAKRLEALGHFDASADRAWVAELTGDSPNAQFYELSAMVHGDEAWTPYLLLKANRLAAEGSPAAAADILALVHPAWEGRAETRAVRLRIRENRNAFVNEGFSDWQSEAIERVGGGWQREYFWKSPPRKVLVRFEETSEGGAAVEVYWSDRLSSCYAVDSRSVVSVTPPKTAGFHLLRIRPVPETRARPVAIDLVY